MARTKAAKGIMAGLKDALAYAEGDTSRATLHKVAAVDVKATRERLGMSQDKFATAFGFSAATVRNWEQGHRHPTGAARVLLRVIERKPKMVLAVLGED